MLTRETRLTQLKLFLNIEQSPKDTTPSSASHSRIVLIGAYTVDNDDEIAPDVNEEVIHDMLAGRSR